MNSYFNFIVFILTTMGYYYFIKPQPTYKDIDISSSPDAYLNYTNKNYVSFAIYFMLVFVTQSLLNIWAIIEKCGGSSSKNIVAALLMTFFPWTFIFGAIILILIIFPGFKNGFSDVIGYFYVSGSAHSVLSDILKVNSDISGKIDASALSEVDKKEMETAASAIIKLFGNMGILINKLVPSNFSNYWEILKPLMKNPNNEELREKLLGIVVTRDNIGECMWFIYTGVLLISIVQYNISIRGCINDTNTIKNNYKKYVEDEEKKQRSDAKQNDVVYKI